MVSNRLGVGGISHTSQHLSYFIELPMKMEMIECSETSAISTQTPGRYPKENTLHIKHGESLKSRILQCKFICSSHFRGSVKPGFGAEMIMFII